MREEESIKVGFSVIIKSSNDNQCYQYVLEFLKDNRNNSIIKWAGQIWHHLVNTNSLFVLFGLFIYVLVNNFSVMFRQVLH